MRAVERFVQVETGLRRSKLVDRLLGDLDAHPAIVVGCLVLLWSEVLDARSGGDLSERSDRWIEEAAGWPGAPGEFAAAIRKHHLDEQGAIRDWDAKYGKLDLDRRKATQVKRNQRDKHRKSTGMSTGQTADCPAISSIYQSISPDLDLGEGERERERVAPLDHPAVMQVTERFGEYAAWPLGLVRAARNPDAVAAALCAHLDGMHGPAYTADVVALAAREYAASDEAAAQGFKPRLFAGYVRRAEGTVKLTESRKQQQNETRFIRREVEQKDRVGEELAAEDQLINDFAGHPAYEELCGEAVRAVPSKWTGKVRESMVRAELAKRIRTYIDGGDRAAS